MTSPIRHTVQSSGDDGCLWLILLIVIAGIGYGIYHLCVEHPTLMIIIGLVIIISAAILLWSNLDLDLTFWTILGITTGVLLVGGILYLINVPIFIVGGSIVVLLFLITFCLLVYGTFEIPILVIASMILVTLGAGIILYIYVSLLVAILSFLALLIAFFFVADWLEDLFY